MEAGSDLKVVMCLATYCRTSQLKAALPINLACSWGLRDKVIWVLADMNDEDESSTLLAWLDKSVAASLASGQLSVVRRGGGHGVGGMRAPRKTPRTWLAPTSLAGSLSQGRRLSSS